MRSARYARNLVHAQREIDRLQDLLLLLRLDVHVGGREIGERRGRGGACSTAINSCGACGSSWIASMACRCRFRKRASISGEVVVGSGI